MANPYESTTFWNSLSLRVDGAIGAMSLSPNGRDAVLAGRRGLFIIDLDDPFTTPRWLHHITSWEVADVQWSPHLAKPSWCISTSNQKALLWDLARPSNNAIANVLHRHTRAITDINFHPVDPELLATCSIDTFVYSWDMRTPRVPVGKWAEWRAGATQVKWNTSNSYQICSSHHHSFYLWDSRKGANPVLRIENAHDGKINGLSFSGFNDKLITCANDNTVKFWELNAAPNEGGLRPTVIIKTDYPVARARCLPFGEDNCCGIMPIRGGGDAVHIVNYEEAYDRAQSLGEIAVMDAIPDYSFKGHNGSLKDFLWRTQHERYWGFESRHSWKEYQLVTWSSQDFDLKLWPHDEKLYDIVNYNPLHQKLLDSLVSSGDKLESENQSPVTTPDSEISEDISLKESAFMKYATYSTEPPLSVTDLAKETNGDILSTWALFKIKQSQETQGGPSQLNQLNWISGVRMGRKTPRMGTDTQLTEDDDGPTNLGEEVSIVGHKFPKIRFEKISVSTGHIVLSLRGPMPIGIEDVSSDNVEEKERRGSISELDDLSGLKSSSAAAFVPLTPNPPVSNNASPITPTTVSTNGPSIPSQNIQKSHSTPSAHNFPPKISGNPRQVPLSTNTSATAPLVDTTLTSGATSEFLQDQKLIFIRLEIKFPKMYPFLEEIDLSRGKRSLRQRKNNQIRFEIEETHELTPRVKKEMLSNLGSIAQFFTNKYNKFCLEPCLRYLLGDKIELDDSLMLDSSENGSATNLSEVSSVEVGNESWVDHFTDHHEVASKKARQLSVSADEDDDDDGDIFPTVSDSLTNSGEFERGLENSDLGIPNTDIGGRIRHDTTPVPKGCGVVWARTGQLVCFFIPKNNEHETEKTLQKFNIFKFTDSGFSLKSTHYRQHHGSLASNKSGTESVASDDEEGGSGVSSLPNSDDEADDSDYSSNISFSNDWDEMLEDDIPSRSRIPGLFKGTVGLGRNLLSHLNGRTSINRTISGKGTGSNYKSSIHDDSVLRSMKKMKKAMKGKNIIAILDFSHLIPDKYELACDYRVLGDEPSSLAKHNFNVALQHGYKDIANIWRIVEMILIKNVHMADADLLEKGLTYSSEKSHFYWGNHPFGHTWLVKELFDYFEKKRNLQMLAMLSCILFENVTNIRSNLNGAFNVPIHTPYSALPPHPSLTVMREFGLITPDLETSATPNQLPHTTLGSPVSRKNSIISGRESLLSRLIPNSVEQQTRSESPGKVGSLRKLLPGSPYPESFLPFDQSILKTSKSYDGIKKLSKGPVARKPSRGVQLRKSSGLNSSAFQQRQRSPPTITIDMKNISEADYFENVYTSSLLSELDPARLLSYRHQYAEMLYAWGLPFHRIKILKFNFPEENQNCEISSSSDVYKFNFGYRNRNALSANELLVKPITPIPTAKNNAWNSKKRNELQYCGICGLPISKRVIVCTICEHVLHSHCATVWWSIDDSEKDCPIMECPTGCGCHCLDNRV